MSSDHTNFVKLAAYRASVEIDSPYVEMERLCSHLDESIECDYSLSERHATWSELATLCGFTFFTPASNDSDGVYLNQSVHWDPSTRQLTYTSSTQLCVNGQLLPIDHDALYIFDFLSDECYDVEFHSREYDGLLLDNSRVQSTIAGRLHDRNSFDREIYDDFRVMLALSTHEFRDNSLENLCRDYSSIAMVVKSVIHDELVSLPPFDKNELAGLTYPDGITLQL